MKKIQNAIRPYPVTCTDLETVKGIRHSQQKLILFPDKILSLLFLTIFNKNATLPNEHFFPPLGYLKLCYSFVWSCLLSFIFSKEVNSK